MNSFSFVFLFCLWIVSEIVYLKSFSNSPEILLQIVLQIAAQCHHPGTFCICWTSSYLPCNAPRRICPPSLKSHVDRSLEIVFEVRNLCPFWVLAFATSGLFRLTCSTKTIGRLPMNPKLLRRNSHANTFPQSLSETGNNSYLTLPARPHSAPRWRPPSPAA